MTITFSVFVDALNGADTSFFFPGTRAIIYNGGYADNDRGMGGVNYLLKEDEFPQYSLDFNGHDFTDGANQAFGGQITSGVYSIQYNLDTPKIAIGHLSIAFDGFLTAVSVPSFFDLTPDGLLNTTYFADPTLQMIGNAGPDKLYASERDDLLDGKGGADLMAGHGGNDRYYVDNAADKVIELASGGTDSVYSSVAYTLAANVERLTLTGTAAINGTGNTADNVLTGNGAANVLTDSSGKDTLYGAGGHDTLTGGADADLFQFRALAESTVASSGRDTIKDFSHAQGDRIDLHYIDASTATSGNQAFSFIGSGAFTHHAGELRAQSASTYTVVSGDVNGDGVADFAIQTNKLTFVAGDFVL